MHLQLDEQQQQHIYSCLLVGGEKFQNVKKNLEKLDQDVADMDDELQINAKLRQIFNPRAEEEARDRDRAKHDPDQMDLTKVPSSGETGGGIKAGQVVTRITTPPAPTDDALCDSLFEIDRVLSLADIRGWTNEERTSVITWVGQVVAAQVIAGTIPDEPECLAVVAISVARFDEFLAMGPFAVQAGPKDEAFEVINTTTLEVDETLVDSHDAEVRAARLNRGALLNADITPEDIEKFANLGPWSVFRNIKGDFTIATVDRQSERCESEADANARAARYNRTIAQREWVASNTPPKVTEDAAQEIQAAVEAGVATE